jgi:ABC-type transport system involved in multi-copper enzyme maturation permease subunit
MSREKVKKQSWGRQLLTQSSRYLRVISSDRYYLGLLAVIPIVIGLICYSTAGELGLGPGLPTKAGDLFNPMARSNLMILILGTVFIGLSTIQSMIFVAIVLFNRPVPDGGLFFESGYLEVLSLAVLLGFACMCLGLLMSAILSSSEQAMPILVGLTMTQVVLSGALPGENEGFIALVSPLVPSFWSMNALSASTNLAEISKVTEEGLANRWEAVLGTLAQGSAAVAAMSLIFLVLCYGVLSKKR